MTPAPAVSAPLPPQPNVGWGWWLLTLLWVLLALYHIPLGGASGEDAIGVYDLVFAAALGLYGFFWLLHPAARQTTLRRERALEFVQLFGLWIAVACLSIMLNPAAQDTFSYLLVIKQIQLLGGLVITYRLFSVIPPLQGRRLVDTAMLLLLAGSYYFYITSWWNLPLPFHQGSGAVMGAICFIYTLWVLLSRRLLSAVTLLWLVILLVSGFLTMGRTQILGFVVALGVYTAWQIFSGFTLARLLWIASGLAVLAAAFYTVFYTGLISTEGFYGGNPLQYFNIEKVLADDSFAIRFQHLWPGAIQMWLNEGWSGFLFGIGLGNIRYVDGLFINILVSTGLLGCLAYGILHFWAFWVMPRFRIILVFLWVSSLTGEILLQSYRFHQFLMIISVLFFCYTPLRPVQRQRAAAVSMPASSAAVLPA